jgi:hypothetical protein
MRKGQSEGCAGPLQPRIATDRVHLAPGCAQPGDAAASSCDVSTHAHLQRQVWSHTGPFDAGDYADSGWVDQMDRRDVLSSR